MPTRPSQAAPVQFCGAPLKVEFLRPDALTPAERERWARLSEHAAPGNIFAQDWFMGPALRHCRAPRSLRLAVVRQASGAWLGVLPLSLSLTSAVAGRTVPCLSTWQGGEPGIGTPLVRIGAERAFWLALLAALDQRPGLALGLNCSALPMDDPATLGLISLCAEQGRACYPTGQFSRPARLPATAVAGSKVARRLDRRLDRLELRLAEKLGPVNLVLHDRRADCEPWLAAFLALERAGWKGRSHSATSACPHAMGLMREAIREGHRRGAVQLASLTAGEQIVAMISWFAADGHGYGFKTTFDEAWRAYAPGRLLMRRVAGLIEADALLLFDTCAMPDAPDDPLWPDRRVLSGFAVSIGGRVRAGLLHQLLGPCPA